MLTSGFGSIRQSLQTHKTKKSSDVPHRDSDGGQAQEYSIDVELSDNNKKMLEQFKIASGFYNTSPKKSRKSTTPSEAKKQVPSTSQIQQDVPRIYLFGNNGNYFEKSEKQQQEKQTASQKLVGEKEADNQVKQPGSQKVKEAKSYVVQRTVQAQRTRRVNEKHDFLCSNKSSAQAVKLVAINYIKDDPSDDTSYKKEQSKAKEIKEQKKNSEQAVQGSSNIKDSKKDKQFIKQVLLSLNLYSPQDDLLSFQQLLKVSRSRYQSLRNSGRMPSISSVGLSSLGKIMRTSFEDELAYSMASNLKSSFRKKSIVESHSTKKVKLLEPETAEQMIQNKYRTTEELEQKLGKLVSGFTFEKFCFNTLKIEEVKVYVSYDLKCIAWQPKGKQPVIESMLEYNGILDGPRSKNYHRYIRTHPIDEHLAFSIILNTRTVDLMARKYEDKAEFIECMKFARTFV